MKQEEMKLSQKNKQEIIEDPKINIAYEDRCLCVKDIIEKLNQKKMNLIDQTKNIIKEMKVNEQKQRNKDNKNRLDNFNGIEQLLREFKYHIDCIFVKIFNNIQSKLNQIQKDIRNIEQQSMVLNFENDIEKWTQYQEYQINEQSIKLMKDDHMVIEQIQNQLESFINFEQQNKLIGDSINVMNPQTEQDLQNNEFINRYDYKTSALKLICEEHKKEIIMFNLNINAQPKIACIKCIQQYPTQYTSLEDACIQWDLLQKRNQTSINDIKNIRNSIQKNILKVIQDAKSQNDQIFDELIKSLINQQQSIQQMNQNQINTKQMYYLTSNQIHEIVNQLSQTDNSITCKNAITNIEKIDYIFYSDLRSRFEHLIQLQQINLQRFNQILINDNLIINIIQSTQNKDENNEIESINQIMAQTRQFMMKLFKFEFSQKVFIETIEKYIKVKEDMLILNQILNNRIEKSQEFQNIFNEFNMYSEKFNQDYIQFEQFLEINQILNQITILKEQIETIKNQKQEQLTSFEKNINKMKEVNQQINKQNLESKSAFEKQIIEKDLEIKKLKDQIQSINNQNLYYEQNLNKFSQNLKKFSPNFKTLFQIVSSQYQKQLTFSQIHKHSTCQVSQNGKIVENGLYCLCDQVIPKNEVTSFAFKIISLSNKCYIGIGMRDIIINNNYKGDVAFGYGSYTIRQDRYCYSHHVKDDNWKRISFEFTINDIIIIEVDIQNKNIKWTKADTNQSVTLQIETNYDLYPCLWVHYDGGVGNKVQILESLI